MWRRAIARVQSNVTRYIKEVGEVGPPEETALFRFSSPEETARWEVFTDTMLGGCSTASLTHRPEHGDAIFEGELSSKKGEVQPGERVLRRSGFCGMRTLSIGKWSDQSFIDLEPYNVLGFQVKGDGRPYIATIRTDNWAAPLGAPPDLWQAFLFSPPGVWTNVEIPFQRFLLTWRGRVIEQPRAMSSGRVLSLGISLALGDKLQKPGPFQLELKGIHAARRDVLPTHVEKLN